MQKISPALVFYLQYYDEMERHYTEHKPLPAAEARPDKEAIFKRIEAIGEQAHSNAADLISACVADRQEQLRTIKGVKLRSNRRSTIESNWRIEIDVFADENKSNGVRRQLGLLIDRDELVPWLWSRGGRKAEERMLSHLGSAATSGRARNWDGGAVTLRPTRINWQAAKNFQLDAEPIIAEVRENFRIITPEFVRGWLREE